MSDIAIRVDRLGKSYRIGDRRSPYKTLRDTLASVTSVFFRQPTGREDSPENTFWALKDVSFEVKRGEVLGIIGRNGAGKSTLLKVLSRITEPTAGFVETRGRVGSLLEVGTGFHPELTGRENIYLNGAILGMHHTEIRRKFAAILEFAEIEQFLDTPVKHYSSGMYTRLAFSVAAHLEPEILIVDEVLAVGDMEFQKKCMLHISKLRQQGSTILIVSHNLTTMEMLCDRGLLLAHGTVVAHTDIGNTIELYHRLREISPRAVVHQGERSSPPEDDFEIQWLKIEDYSVGVHDHARGGTRVRLQMRYIAHRPLANPRFTWHIWRDGERILTVDSQFDGLNCSELHGPGELECEFNLPRLIPGTYYIKVSVGAQNNPVRLGGWGWDDQSYYFTVELSASNGIVPKEEWGTLHVEGRWTVHLIDQATPQPITPTLL